MTVKIVFSKPTYNAVTETDPDNLVFSSDYDTLKYETFGNITVESDKADYYYVDVGGGLFGEDVYYNRTVETVAHGLPYTPYITGYNINLFNPPLDDIVIQSPFAIGDFGFFVYLGVYADATYLYFLVQYNTLDNSGTVDSHFNYRIFKNDTGL